MRHLPIVETNWNDRVGEHSYQLSPPHPPQNTKPKSVDEAVKVRARFAAELEGDREVKGGIEGGEDVEMPLVVALAGSLIRFDPRVLKRKAGRLGLGAGGRGGGGGERGGNLTQSDYKEMLMLGGGGGEEAGKDVDTM